MRDASLQRLPQIPAGRGAEWVPVQCWTAPAPLGQAMTAATAPTGLSVPAYANHGRWVVECPDCRGAQLACRTDLRFMCCECANAAVGGLWRPVTWPVDVAAIEAELEKRPDPETQNWLPGEALQQLVAEREAGGPVLVDELANAAGKVR